MTSYHRVLQVHGRSVHGKTVECDYDIHPSDVVINGERWAGKVRLVGFADAFYLICYTGESKFEHGIVMYKDDEVIRKTLDDAKLDPARIKLDVVNKARVEAKGCTEPPRYFRFETEKGGLDYKITSLGHQIDLRTKYPRSCLRKYEIKLQKGRDPAMVNVVRLGNIAQAEFLGLVIGKTIGGTTTEDLLHKCKSCIARGKRSRNLTLASAPR
ncbi:hypothetical protein VTH06DRAFT_7592 [Thermothelomyces fergusii]